MARKVGKRKTREKRILEPATYLVASEGTKTEVLYFQQMADGLSRKYQGYEDRVTVPNFDIEGMGTSNFRLIEDVVAYLRTSPRLFENIWLVFDKDDIPENYFDNAIKKAASLGWQTAWANDSFELWFLLHFEYLQSGSMSIIETLFSRVFLYNFIPGISHCLIQVSSQTRLTPESNNEVENP